MDHLKTDQGKRQFRDMEQRMNNVLAIAAASNRILLYRQFDADMDRDWQLPGSDLNALASTYDLPALPSCHVRNYSQLRP
ncbi:MAG: hypothetical protein ABI972_16805 [Acidobacteriota bacterium]